MKAILSGCNKIRLKLGFGMSSMIKNRIKVEYQ